jgi:hypothetical protein
MLMVDESIVHRFGCPRCLALLQTAQDAAAPLTMVHPPSPTAVAARRVQTVEAQALGDERFSRWLVYGIIILAVVGGFALAYSGEVRAGVSAEGAIVFSLVTVFAFAIAVMIWETARGASGDARAAARVRDAPVAEVTDASPANASPANASPAAASPAAGQLILHYATPRPRRRSTEPHEVGVLGLWGQFFGGAVLGVIGQFVLIVAGGVAGIVAAVVIPVALGIGLMLSPGSRGFGAGLFLSPALSFLIVLGICSGFKF